MDNETEIKDLLQKAIHTEIDMEALDEDFLTEVDKVKKIAKPRNNEVKRRPCANCTCGATDGGKKDFKSACGSCYLGDAFRCADCPYSGYPPFKPGEKVNFDMDEDPFGKD